MIKGVVPVDKKTDQTTERLNLWDIVLSVLLGSLVVIMFIQVFFRYVLNNSLSWSEELAKYLFVWMTFLGAALCLRDKVHIGVDYFVSLLPEPLQQAVQRFNLVLIIVFSSVVAVTGFIWVVHDRGTVTPALGWPLNTVFYGALPVGSVLMAFYGIRRLISQYKGEQ
jgi:TRAP-type C4-dicarboxylate transport system permease small subunit